MESIGDQIGKDHGVEGEVNLAELCRGMATQARVAATQLRELNAAAKNAWLHHSAERLHQSQHEILEANAQDLTQAQEYGLDAAAMDRLKLTTERIRNIVDSLRQVAALPDPVGEIIEGGLRPNGLTVAKIRVPLGVIFFLYESRPNVTVDAAALCVKSGNAVILRGGKEAAHTNRCLYQLLAHSLVDFGIPSHAVQLVTTPDRNAVGEFLKLNEWIDLTIPRGGESLIRRVVAEATMPVLKHYQGICHVYIDDAADYAKAEAIVVNAKCQRPGTCNAAETLLVHADAAKRFLPQLAEKLQTRGVELRGCEQTCQLVSGARTASPADYATEHLALILSVKVVPNLQAALDHIAQYGTGHTEAIVTENYSVAEQFITRVDSSAVMVNASTRFNDGYELGLGAEIGISTDKFHARGPCGLRELTTTKYIVRGMGHIRG